MEFRGADTIRICSFSFLGINMRRKSHDYMGGKLNVRPQQKRIDSAKIYEFFTWLFGILASIFLGFIVVFFFGEKTSVVGTSMEPTLSNGEEVYIDKVVYQFSQPKRGDIIVFRPNGNENTHLYVKRVIGLPGEKIQIKNSQVYIDDELYLQDVADETIDPGIVSEPMQLGPEDYFVLGDDRGNSEDSRSANIGNVTRGMIEGKAWLSGGGPDDEIRRID